MSYDEIIDIVSPNDVIIGQEKRSIVYAKKLNFRVINAIIYNDQKQFWIPRRHPTKKLFPLSLDASVGGHVLAGESYDDAFIREAREEINFDPTQYTYKKLAYITPYSHGTSAFMWIYVILSNEAPCYNKNDFIADYWLSYNDFVERLHNGDTAKSDLLPILTSIKDLL